MTAALVGAVGAGKRVQVLTNSLIANDVAAVHGGYSRYRRPLLEGGVQLWELKPLPGTARSSSLFGSSGASLHTKALSTDGRTLFVGSYNVDPRSTWLNCEQGVLVEDPLLTAELDGIFSRQTTGQHAWQVTIEEGELSWSDGEEKFRFRSESDRHAQVPGLADARIASGRPALGRLESQTRYRMLSRSSISTWSA